MSAQPLINRPCSAHLSYVTSVQLSVWADTSDLAAHMNPYKALFTGTWHMQLAYAMSTVPRPGWRTVRLAGSAC